MLRAFCSDALLPCCCYCWRRHDLTLQRTISPDLNPLCVRRADTHVRACKNTRTHTYTHTKTHTHTCIWSWVCLLFSSAHKHACVKQPRRCRMMKISKSGEYVLQAKASNTSARKAAHQNFSNWRTPSRLYGTPLIAGCLRLTAKKFAPHWY